MENKYIALIPGVSRLTNYKMHARVLNHQPISISNIHTVHVTKAIALWAIRTNYIQHT
jgi:hypothetical protein